jgi:endogenous inhibitor of DNA gyrase (YacG/DUF329 family)
MASPDATLCPICKKPVDADASGDARSHFPFCSDRCKLIDLGRWLDGRYQVPVSDDEDNSEEPPTPSFPTDADD